MKHIPILLLIIIIAAFGSCKKEQATSDKDITIEPIPPKIIASDTLTMGAWWGLKIGDPIPDIYKTIQSIQTDKKINYLGIIGNVFTKIEDLEKVIPLYTSIFLDEKSGTENGIQIYFADNKVKAIWTNSGTELNRWPSNTDRATTIAKNDPVENVYPSLINIKRIAAFANKFERISLFSKDINKAYDAQMSASPKWELSATVSDKRFYVIALNFSSGLLTSIYATLYEQQA